MVIVTRGVMVIIFCIILGLAVVIPVGQRPEFINVLMFFLVWMLFFTLDAATSEGGEKKRITNVVAKQVFLFLALAEGISFFYRTVWEFMMEYQVAHPGVINLTEVFVGIPLNDISVLSQVAPGWVNQLLHFAYGTGYVSPLYVPVLISFYHHRFEQGWRYFLSGHLLQCVLIFPLLMLFQTQEIWYVKHIPDGLYRSFDSEIEMLKVSFNCFPSMHTSIAMASLVACQREGNVWFRRAWSVYCGMTIVSTVFFPVHWVLDVVAGMILGWLSVRFVDKMILVGSINYGLTMGEMKDG